MGFATLPNQVHRKTVKKGFTFTLMVAGEKSSTLFELNPACHSDCAHRGLNSEVIWPLPFCFSGESGLGKSTLINSLFLTDLYRDRRVPSAQGEIRHGPKKNLEPFLVQGVTFF